MVVLDIPSLSRTHPSTVAEFPPVLLALSSSSLLEQLRGSWLLEPRIPGWGVTAEGADAARWLVAFPEGVAFCDVSMLRHTAIRALFAGPAAPPACRIVLVATEDGLALVPEEIPVYSVLDADTGSEGVAHLLRMLAAPENGRSVRSSTSTEPAISLSSTLKLESRADVSVQCEPCKHTRIDNPLIERIRQLQGDPGHPRDQDTGLTTIHLLTQIVAALPALNQPATIAVVALRTTAPSDPLKPDEHLARPLRTLAAGLRVHLREDDLICRLNGPAFAMVLSHPSSSAAPLARRLRDMFDAVRHVALRDRADLTAQLGLGFCAPGAAPAQPLARAWRAAAC